MTPQSELTQIGLQLEMRERLVRIETKMDSSAEKVASHDKSISEHDTRLDTLERGAAEQRTQLAMLKWVGGGIVAVASLFGDNLFHLIF